MNPDEGAALELMTPSEAAQLLGVGEPLLDQWVSEGRVPHAFLDGQLWFDRRALLDWLDQQERQSLGGESPCRLPETEL